MHHGVNETLQHSILRDNKSLSYYFWINYSVITTLDKCPPCPQVLWENNPEETVSGLSGVCPLSRGQSGHTCLRTPSYLTALSADVAMWSPTNKGQT